MASRPRRVRPAGAEHGSSPTRKAFPAGGELLISGGIEVRGACAGFFPRHGVWRATLAQLSGALGYPQVKVRLQICGDGLSSRLNLEHLGVPQPTDILSFPAQVGAPLAGTGQALGDLVLNLQYAWRRRGRFFRRFEMEAAFLVFHGLLHLSGRHHDSTAQQRRLDRLQAQHFPPPAALLNSLKPLKRPS